MVELYEEVPGGADKYDHEGNEDRSITRRCVDIYVRSADHNRLPEYGDQVEGSKTSVDYKRRLSTKNVN